MENIEIFIVTELMIISLMTLRSERNSGIRDNFQLFNRELLKRILDWKFLKFLGRSIGVWSGEDHRDLYWRSSEMGVRRSRCGF